MFSSHLSVVVRIVIQVVDDGALVVGEFNATLTRKLANSIAYEMNMRKDTDEWINVAYQSHCCQPREHYHLHPHTGPTSLRPIVRRILS